ncbi:MAG: hypothetical protein Ct9H300mP11_14270 [Chloroflexota bacterium]|nr:MAG: hypothetical protein Ct9H300mP11_14270 [Chloroflexota bacterium]
MKGRRGRATGILFVSHSLGMIAFPFIAGLVIKYRGWEDAWLVLGVLVWVLALGPVSMLVRQSPESVGLLPDGDLPTQQEGKLPRSHRLTSRIGP